MHSQWLLVIFSHWNATRAQVFPKIWGAGKYKIKFGTNLFTLNCANQTRAFYLLDHMWFGKRGWTTSFKILLKINQIIGISKYFDIHLNQSVTNIFEYSNIFDPNIYSDLRSYHFLDTNIFGYSCVTTFWIRIYWWRCIFEVMHT